MPFRVALSADFLTADGSPAYPMFDLSPLDAAGVEYEYVDLVESAEGMTEAMTVPASSVEGFDALILLAAAFTEDSIPSDGRLALVARFGVGFDNVDVDACTAAGIATTITPDGVRRPVAVTVINFMLNLASKLRAKERLARTDDWASRSEYMGVGITDKTLGLLGIGNIGAEICRLIEPFDVNVIAYDPFVDASTAAELGSPPSPPHPPTTTTWACVTHQTTTNAAPPHTPRPWRLRHGGAGVEMVDLDGLFDNSDFLSINCPLNEETRGMINAARLEQMKDTSFLINTARGPIVDEAALLTALEGDVIAGAAIDVFEVEPPPADHPLFGTSTLPLPLTRCTRFRPLTRASSGDRGVSREADHDPPLHLLDRRVLCRHRRSLRRALPRAGGRLRP